MNAIEYSLSYLKRNIPKEVLEIGLLVRDDVTNRYTSLDDKILINIINPIVKVDLNLLGGVYTSVLLRDCIISRVPNTLEFLIKVPKELTSGRSIIGVLNIIANTWNREDTSYMSTFHANTAVQYASKMLAAAENTSIITTSRLELIGENIIVCKDPGYALLNTTLNCQIENHENLENLHRAYYQYIGELVTLATKMYIWTNRVISLNMGQIYGGHELSIVKELIEEYKDAQEQYKEKIKDWSVISYANSREKMDRYITRIVGNNP